MEAGGPSKVDRSERLWGLYLDLAKAGVSEGGHILWYAQSSKYLGDRATGKDVARFLASQAYEDAKAGGRTASTKAGVEQPEDVPHQPSHRMRDEDMPEGWSPADEDPDNDVEPLRQSAGEPDDEPVLVEVDKPVPLTFQRAPEFPVHVLPGQLRAYVEAVARAYQQTPDLAFATALFNISVATRRAYKAFKFNVPMGAEDWSESLAIWVLVLLDSGERKTPVVNLISKPLDKWEARIQEEFRNTLEARSIAGAKAAKTLKMALDGKSTSYTLPENPADWSDADHLWIEDLRALENEAKKPEPLVFCDNSTPEAVMWDLANNNGVLAIKDDESTYFRNVGGRYANGSAETGPINKAYEEGSFKVQRRGAGASYQVRYAYLPTLVASQPETCAAIFSKSQADMVASGFLWRFLIAMPPSMDERDDYNPHSRETVPKPLQAWWEKSIMDVLTEAEKVKSRGRRQAIRPVDEKAVHAFEVWDGEIKRLRRHPDYRHAKGAFNKLAGNTLKIAANLTVFQGEKKISLETMETAIEIGRYYAEQARITAAYLLSHRDTKSAAPPTPHEEAELTTKVVEFVTAKSSPLRSLDMFSQAELYKKVRNTLPAQYRGGGGAALFYQHFWHHLINQDVIVVAEETARTTKYRLND
ncbi:DUF3987 domain-containing protein [Streptomyces sp. NPDC004542]|uniref:DUF3987 domain-containing protein n=1 Tax=Streptomyces sp. NPDC004542 TaxID=3154281 RepID=UPI0033BD572C